MSITSLEAECNVMVAFPMLGRTSVSDFPLPFGSDKTVICMFSEGMAEDCVGMDVTDKDGYGGGGLGNIGF